MIRNDPQWLHVANTWADAALDGQWEHALRTFAAATGSRCGELIGLGRESAVPFNLMTDCDPQTQADFIAANGGDPQVNPRVRAGGSAAELTVLAESDFISPDEHRRNAHYRDWAWPHDLPYICLSPLIKQPDLLIGLAVIRSARQGHISEPERHIFESLAAHARAAVRTQMILDDQRSALLAETMDAVSLTAFICDSRARIIGMSANAEALLQQGSALRSLLGLLCTGCHDETQQLHDAIAAAGDGVVIAGGAPVRLRTLILWQRRTTPVPLIVDVIGLPRREGLFTKAKVLVIVGRKRRDPQQTALILRRAFGLSAAEAEVALLLNRGLRPERIAEQREVGIGTVRAQVRNIFMKLHVSGQVELIALLGQLDNGADTEAP